MPKEKKSILFIAAVIAELIVFLFITKDSVLTVHDDIITYMQVRRGDLWNTALSDAQNGRICHIPLTYLLYIPYFADSPFVVRIFACLSLGFDLSAVFLLFRKILGKDFAYLAVLTTISSACISNQHNLFVSYIIGHQIPLGLALYSMFFFLKYYDNKKKPCLIISSAFFVSSCCLYEAACAYIVMLVMICVLHCKGKKRSDLLCTMLKDMRFHIIGLLLFFCIYFGWRMFYPSNYDGAKIWFGNIPLSLLTMIKYSFGMLPGFPAAAMFIKKYITFNELLSSLTPAVLIIPLISSAAFYFLFNKTEITRKKLPIILFCTAGIILPNSIMSFTEKYTSWAKTNSYSYVTSFYSYFFLIPLILFFLKILFKNPVKKPVLIFLTSVFFLASLAVEVSNTAWNKYFEKKLVKYEAFSSFVKDDYFDRIPDGSVIFIPDYYGIHGDMETTAAFAHVYSSGSFSFENEASKLDFSEPVYCMRYDPETNSVLIGEINENFCSDSVYIIGNYSKPVTENFDMMAAFKCSIEK